MNNYPKYGRPDNGPVTQWQAPPSSDAMMPRGRSVGMNPNWGPVREGKSELQTFGRKAANTALQLVGLSVSRSAIQHAGQVDPEGEQGLGDPADRRPKYSDRAEGVTANTPGQTFQSDTRQAARDSWDRVMSRRVPPGDMGAPETSPAVRGLPDERGLPVRSASGAYFGDLELGGQKAIGAGNLAIEAESREMPINAGSISYNRFGRGPTPGSPGTPSSPQLSAAPMPGTRSKKRSNQQIPGQGTLF